MAETIKDAAKESVDKTLESGQTVTQGDMSVTRANLATAHKILKDEDDRKARRSGRRPLFRSFNLSGVQ